MSSLSAGKEAEANRRTGAFADNDRPQDETHPVSTPGSGVNVKEAEQEFDALQERLREEQRK